MVSCNTFAEERSGILLNADLSTAYTDNVLNNIEEKSDSSITFSPDAKYLALIGKHKFLLSYDGEYSVYKNDSKLNYNNHALALGAKFDHSHKFSTEFKLGYDKKFEDPGSTNSSTLALTEFNKFNVTSALAKVSYGQRTSIGQIVVGLKRNEREFTNNSQSFRDVIQNQLTATFFYRIAPKTRLLFQASTAEYKYDDQSFGINQVFNQSSDQNLYLAGIEWEATAKSTGVFKIGYQDKDYQDTRFNDISGLSYALDMIWKPNTYTQINLGTTRQTTESAQIDQSGFLSTSYSIGLSHNIMSRTALNAKYIFDNDDIVTSSKRSDKRNTAIIGISHSLRTWLNINLDYKYQDKSSNIDEFNYESNTIELTLESEFK